MTVKVGYNQDTCTYCCGFHEIGTMEISSNEDFHFEGYRSVELDKAIPTMLEVANGRPIMFNFVRNRARCRAWDEDLLNWLTDVPFKRLYEAAQLRRLVKRYPGCKHIGTWINPGTGNQIDSYVILNKETE